MLHTARCRLASALVRTNVSQCPGALLLRRGAVIFRNTIQVTTGNLLRPGNLILDLLDVNETLAGQALQSPLGRAEQYGPRFGSMGMGMADVSKDCRAASCIIPATLGQHTPLGVLLLALPSHASPIMLRCAERAASLSNHREAMHPQVMSFERWHCACMQAPRAATVRTRQHNVGAFWRDLARAAAHHIALPACARPPDVSTGPVGLLCGQRPLRASLLAHRAAGVARPGGFW